MIIFLKLVEYFLCYLGSKRFLKLTNKEELLIGMLVYGNPDCGD